MSTSRRKLISRTSGGFKYRGIQMNCAAGVHDEAERLILAYLDTEVERADLQVLDIAAGFGAMTQRLLDGGFTGVHAWDIDPFQMTVPDVQVESVDLNGEFGADHASEFDVVIAIEVVEHLENPRQFVRNLARVMKRGGVAIVTTPNIESAVSRIDFLARGGVRWFTRHDRASWGHATPVFSWQLKEAADAAGLKLLERGHNSRAALLTIEPGARATAKALLALAMYPWMSGDKQGDISVWAFVRPRSA